MTLFFLLVLLPSYAGETVRVVSRNTPPFSFQDKTGTWRGIAIELWQDIAEDLNLSYEITLADSLEDVFSGIQTGEYDFAVAGLTITSDREKIVDFSQPYLSSSLGVAYLNDGNPWLHVLAWFLSPPFLKILFSLLGLLFLAGFGVWFFEHKKNPEFSAARHEGIGSGFWWAAVTMTTVGYGDKSPKTFGGRCIAVIWMFACIVILSLFTASVVSSLGEGVRINDRKFSNLEDQRLGTIRSSTSAVFLDHHNLIPQTYDTVQQAMQALSSNEIDAAVYDLPILQYYARRDKKQIRTESIANQRQHYGLVMRLDAPWRNDVNVSLLALVRKPVWRDICNRYMGEK